MTPSPSSPTKKIAKMKGQSSNKKSSTSTMQSATVKTEGGQKTGTPVDFLYKTMLERDPKKRRIKPVDHKNFESLSLDDLSSDDEEYVPKGGEDDEDDLDMDEDDDDSNGEDEDDDEDDDESSGNEEEQPSILKSMLATPISMKSPQKTIQTLGGLSDRLLVSPRKSDLSSKINDIRICSVCCGDRSLDADEIVECDSCSITVHENCYGVSEETADNDSVHSTMSSASTEPWFCDACKANIQNPSCDLCPNTGGIFKMTDTGRWIHMICALYITGVAFEDTLHLTDITLFELSSERWGSKACSLCEDERFCRTGITISCDAGLCRTYFHVTCAQREGLLQEVQDTEEEIVDPFVAHCKVHAVEKSVVKSKKRNFLSLQSRMKFKKNSMSPLSSRTAKKLEQAREKWRKKHKFHPTPNKLVSPRFHDSLPSHVPLKKTPRLLSTSPAAVKILLKKAELMGFTPAQHQLIQDAIDIRRKWHVPPAFSVEFVTYYFDRENRIHSMRKKISELKIQADCLNKEDTDGLTRMNEIMPTYEQLKETSLNLKSQARSIWTSLDEIRRHHRKDSPNDPVKMPAIFESPVKAQKRVHQPETTHQKASMKRKLSFSGNLRPGSQEFKLKECGTCKGKKDQHQFALCDSCRLYYHLYCLDPPLTRMPKKTRICGWQCSDCTDKQKELDKKKMGPQPIDYESGDDGSARKRTRRLPDKYLPDESSRSPQPVSPIKKIGRPKLSEKEKKKRLMLAKKKRQDKKIESTISNPGESEVSQESEVLQEKEPKKTIKKEEERQDCCKCNNSSSVRELVQCDDCDLFYHFGCLNPPVKKSPKVRGYQWFCEECDPSSDGDNEERRVKDKEDEIIEKYEVDTSDNNEIKLKKPQTNGKENGDSSMEEEEDHLKKVASACVI